MMIFQKKICYKKHPKMGTSCFLIKNSWAPPSCNGWPSFSAFHKIDMCITSYKALKNSLTYQTARCNGRLQSLIISISFLKTGPKHIKQFQHPILVEVTRKCFLLQSSINVNPVIGAREEKKSISLILQLDINLSIKV